VAGADHRGGVAVFVGFRDLIADHRTILTETLLALARLVGWIDRYVVDGLVNVASALTLRAGAELRRLQTGRAQDYLYGVTAGLLLVLVLWRLWT
jgi:NADH:ubiquinone oxidoreductase subunit 5 (subunit L)/multisubunit Na+/H+ antiporter MnhA subunit